MESVMDYGAMRFYLDVLQLAGIAVIGVYSWISNGRKVNREAIDQIGRDVQQHDRRLHVVESRLADAPTHYDLGQIYERVNATAQEMSRLTGTVAAINHQLGVIGEYLLTREGSKRE